MLHIITGQSTKCETGNASQKQFTAAVVLLTVKCLNGQSEKAASRNV